MQRLEQMFDAEVLAELRVTFDSADSDGSGHIDAEEACGLFASYCEPGSSAAEIKRTATNLLSTLDTDRSGKLSFEEFAFRFGRKLQMELARKRRAGLGNQSTTQSSLASEGLRARVRETAPVEISPIAVSSAIPAGAFVRGAPGGYVRSAPNPAPTMQAATTRPAPATGADVDSLPVARGGWNISREILTIGGIIASLLAILVFATTMPAPGEAGSTHTSSRSHGRTHGR
mmetsp:Transcript_91744/g.148115  ORF Transcript_91744/g.148115 Transcript_91744/m.148115 type:complete len:231 (+) Transcript_91744:76-768(+)